jgi:hypothetical protein
VDRFIKALGKEVLAGLLFVLPGLGMAAEVVCARVAIELKQELALERQGFDAEMKIHNTLESVPLTDVSITVKFMDESGLAVTATSDPNDTNARFFIRIASQDGIDNVTGTGTVAGATTATINWLIIPAPGAAGTTPFGKKYLVGATLRYKVGAEAQTVDVTPDVITVKPMPLLGLDYFLTRDVEADDPLTPEIEPVVPFTLGVRVKNAGLATAQHLKIDSAQPKIVDNVQGLLINFQLTGSSVNDLPAVNTLLMDFGDIAPATSKMGRWVMESTLSGRFTEFSARFSHADELGGTLTSLMQGVESHLLLRDVRVDMAGRDAVRDFLAEETDGSLKVYESDSADSVVANLSAQATLSASGGSGDTAVYQLSAPASSGFFFIKKVDPFGGAKALGAITRADNKVMAPENVWLSRTRDPVTKEWQYWVNFFDFNSPGGYQTEFVPPASVTAPPQIQFVADQSVQEGDRLSFLVQASSTAGAPALAAAPLPAGATFAAQSQQSGLTTALFDWTPAVGQTGSYLLVYTATRDGLSSTRSSVITVQTREPPPGPGTPQIETPVPGQIATVLKPTLVVHTGTHPQDPTTKVVFQLFADAAMSQQLATATIDKGVTTGIAGTTSWTIPTDLADNTPYWWRARAYDGSLLYSAWTDGNFFVNQFNDLPSSFALLTPLHNGEVAVATPTLVAQNAHDVDGDTITYGFDLYADEAGTQRLSGTTGQAPGAEGTTSWTVDVPLQNHVAYYWQAEAKDSLDAVNRPPMHRFVVNTFNSAPTVPVLVSPAEAALFATTTVALTAQASTDAENDLLSYVVDVDTVNTFDSTNRQSSPPLAAAAGQVTWTPTALPDNTKYYWRVTVSDGFTTSVSEVRQFTVNIANDAPPVPVLDNPGNSSWVSTLTPTLSVFPVTDVDGDTVQYRYEVRLCTGSNITTQLRFSTFSTNTQVLASNFLDHYSYCWRARAEDGKGGVSAWSAYAKFYVSTTAYVAPTLAINAPSGMSDPYYYGGNYIQISYSGSNPSNEATISLYYDTANSGYSGTQFKQFTRSYGSFGYSDQLVTTGMAPGRYYIYGEIQDTNSFLRSAYARGLVMIAKPNPAGQVIATMTGSGTNEYGAAGGGIHSTINVSLSQAPTANVQVSYSSSNNNEGNAGSVTFTPTNWTPKNIYVYGVDDCAKDGDVSYTLTSARIQTEDIEFHGRFGPTFTLVNFDNDAATPDYSDNPAIAMCAPIYNSYTTISAGVYEHSIRGRVTNIGANVSGLTVTPVSLPAGWTLVQPMKFWALSTGSSGSSTQVLKVRTSSPTLTIPVMQWHITSP